MRTTTFLVLSLVVAALTLVSYSTPAAAQDIPITECGQTIPRDQTAVLQNDLDCADLSRCILEPFEPCVQNNDCPGQGNECDVKPPGIMLEPDATLRLNGFNIIGDRVSVGCQRHCQIDGPGAIVGAKFFGIVVPSGPIRSLLRGGRITLSNLTIADTKGPAIAFCGRLYVDNVTVVNSGRHDMMAGRLVIGCGRVEGTNLTILDSGVVETRKIRVDGLSVSGNPTNDLRTDGVGIYSYRRAEIKNGTFTGNKYGLWAERKCKLENTVVSGNREKGILCGRVILPDSTIIDNPDATGFDVESKRKPKLFGASTCGTSLNPKTGEPWGVCEND